ncbi:hypothetical protein M422DRAFT_67438 [Sphaerobolus stellatus SS14]|uniref:Unplaced genomic scaffold SPHSTscaffold_40, whole genome shotgun sequence n=1 Tax=Sphaerobolus stellatus (strain SS14) TaxID=990650 RepID=A0A0C9UP07_SPHS4|nr:hypothetical protein M422DRAFT_67438 [Sphaerobolus stellatus SS14]
MTVVTDAWSSEVCKHMFFWEPVGALISTVLSQMTLGNRVYALYGKSRIIGALLVTVLVIEIGFGAYAISTTSPPPPTPGPSGSKPPCGAVMGPRVWLITFWSIPLFYDLLTFLLTGWTALRFWKQQLNVPLFTVIWRDGVLYFFAIFSMNLTNIIIFLTVPQTLRAINLTPTLVFEIVLSCRLLLNLRGTQENYPPPPAAWKPVNASSRTQVPSSQENTVPFGDNGYRGRRDFGFTNSQAAPGRDIVIYVGKETETGINTV